VAVLRRSGLTATLRSLVLVGCWWGSGGPEGWWLGVMPWWLWGWQAVGMRWPAWRQQPEWRLGYRWGREVERVALLGSLSLGLSRAVPAAMTWGWLSLERLAESSSVTIGLTTLLGCLCVGSGSQVCLRKEVNEQGEVVAYGASLEGHFELTVAADDFFRRRLLILFLRLLEEPGHQRGSRRTRSGRTPAVRQQALAATYGITQPEISRWERYWQAGDWRRLLSERAQDILTLALQERVVAVFAHFPWWGVEQVHEYLQQQGERVSLRQIRQAAQESGWSRLRQELQQRYHLSPERIQPRDNWLVNQLLATNQMLLAKVETAAGLTPQEQLQLADLTRLTTEVGECIWPPLKAVPWAWRLEQLLFGSWEAVTDGEVRCLYCHSTQVARKSGQPRVKRYYDETGTVQTVAVYRYYCRNADCDKGTFTHLPPGLLPYSPYRQQIHLLALQLVVCARTTYRGSAAACALAPPTLYRWLTAYGQQLLPVAALFGVVRCSGVVGIDEKYVLVPKNDKPQARMKRWCYVYVAVDCYTYDLLHIAIYAHRNEASTRAFLLELRAKGYLPRVVVTDLWPGYAALLADLLPQATHHECIFHALQEVQRLIKTIYGPDYCQSAPHALALKQAIYHIFDARTRRTAQKRYQALMDRRDDYTAHSQPLTVVFLFLEHHWPKLVNAIGSKTIPTTNNATELVIRRFDQHYQNFCGFDSLASAQLFLALFEKCYRFTPFSRDAQPHLRGKCPLQLAGYDISQLPMTAIAAGWSPDWPLHLEVNLVPNL
jgi:transposase-like protein